MSEYTKLTSDDNNSSYSSTFLEENVPFWKKMIKNKNKDNKSSEIELTNLSLKTNMNNLYNNKYYNRMGYSRISQENQNRNNARKGNMNMFLYNKNDEPLIVIGPEWFSSIIVITFFLFFLFLYFYFLKNLINPTIQYYGKIICFIEFILYIICFLKNPGIPPKELWIENYFKNKNNKDNDINFSIKICKDCKIIIENNQYIEHCKICNVCITEMSYHCFWIGKCIGKKNKIYFYAFLFTSFILLLYLVFAFISIPFFNENNDIQK